MIGIIDVHDLPKEQARLVREFVEFLRRRHQTSEFIKKEEEKEQEWSKLALSSFAEDWENDKDAIYDGWRKHYRVQ